MLWRTVRACGLNTIMNSISPLDTNSKYLSQTRTWGGNTRNWLFDDDAPKSVAISKEMRWYVQPPFLFDHSSRTVVAAVHRLRMFKVPCNSLLSSMFPKSGYSSICDDCTNIDHSAHMGLQISDHPPLAEQLPIIDDVDHRVFSCTHYRHARLVTAGALRDILFEDDNLESLLLNDADLIDRYFNRRLLLLHDPTSFPGCVNLDRFITPPAHMRKSLALLFHSFLIMSGLDGFLTRSMRPALTAHLAATKAAATHSCDGADRNCICSYFPRATVPVMD